MSDAFSRLQSPFQIVAGDSDGQRISDELALAVLVFHPGRAWERDPHRPAGNQKLDIDCVGVARGDGHNQRLINTVHFLFGPAIDSVKIFVHKKTIADPAAPGKPCTIMDRGRFSENWGPFFMKNLGILLSGRGSNFEAIAKNVAAGRIPEARIAIVISNRADAGGIVTAKKLGLPALVIPSKGKEREAHEREVVTALQQQQVDLVCLAGYMRLLSPWFVRQFPQRILNIHPSLLPAFPGLEAQEQAFAYGVKVSGCTVHFVDEELDHGPILVQKTVPVLDNDDEHTLAARILEQEHIAYSEAIRMVLERKYEVAGRRLRRVQEDVR